MFNVPMIANLAILSPEKASELGLEDGVETEITIKGVAHVWPGGAVISMEETEPEEEEEEMPMSEAAQAAMGAGKKGMM